MLALRRSQVYHMDMRTIANTDGGARMYDTLTIQLPGDVRQMLNRTPEYAARVKAIEPICVALVLVVKFV